MKDMRLSKEEKNIAICFRLCQKYDCFMLLCRNYRMGVSSNPTWPNKNPFNFILDIFFLCRKLENHHTPYVSIAQPNWKWNFFCMISSSLILSQCGKNFVWCSLSFISEINRSFTIFYSVTCIESHVHIKYEHVVAYQNKNNIIPKY